mgnify:CR=1 FL=1
MSDGPSSIQGVNRVGADAEPLFHLATDHLGRREYRTNLETGDGFKAVEGLGGEQPRGGYLDFILGLAEGEQLVAQQQAGGEKRQHLLVRLELVERHKANAVLLREPAQHLVLGEGAGAGVLLQVRAGVSFSELAIRNHADDQLGEGGGGGAQGNREM